MECLSVLADKILQNTTKADKEKCAKSGFSSGEDKENIITTIYSEKRRKNILACVASCAVKKNAKILLVLSAWKQQIEQNGPCCSKCCSFCPLRSNKFLIGVIRRLRSNKFLTSATARLENTKRGRSLSKERSPFAI